MIQRPLTFHLLSLARIFCTLFKLLLGLPAAGLELTSLNLLTFVVPLAFMTFLISSDEKASSNTLFWMILSDIVLWLYTAYRAAHLSMTHDESQTFLSFLQQPVWPCFFSPICLETANNHLLNTWLMQLSVHWFGISEFFIRLPNVLSHGLYILFSILLVRSLNYSFWPALAVFPLLNFNPYLLDFFSLARGYGLSAALFIGAIYFLQRYALAIGSPWQNLFSLYACGWLSIMSNFTALNFMFGVFGVQLLLAIYFLLKGRYTKNQIFNPYSIPVSFCL